MERDVLNLNNRISEVEQIVSDIIVSSVKENAQVTKDFKEKVIAVSENFQEIVDVVTKLQDTRNQTDSKVTKELSDFYTRIEKLSKDVQNVKTISGEKGEKGDIGESGLDGLDGKDGRDGKDGVDGKDGSPDTPQQIAEKINEINETIENMCEQVQVL
jgi:predicted transcriptional regulator